MKIMNHDVLHIVHNNHLSLVIADEHNIKDLTWWEYLICVGKYLICVRTYLICVVSATDIVVAADVDDADANADHMLMLLQLC